MTIDLRRCFFIKVSDNKGLALHLLLFRARQARQEKGQNSINASHNAQRQHYDENKKEYEPTKPASANNVRDFGSLLCTFCSTCFSFIHGCGNAPMARIGNGKEQTSKHECNEQRRQSKHCHKTAHDAEQPRRHFFHSFKLFATAL